MKTSLIKIIDTSKLSTIKSLNPIISQYLLKRDEAESVTYDFIWDIAPGRAYADIEIAIAVSLSKIHDKWVTIGELLERPFGFDITRIEHHGKHYYDFSGPDGLPAGLRDVLCVERWWDKQDDLIYNERSDMYVRRVVHENQY